MHIRKVDQFFKRIPSSCQKEAKKLLSERRAIDWSKATVKVCFDEAGITVSAGGKQETVPYEKMSGEIAAVNQVEITVRRKNFRSDLLEECI